VDHIGDLVNENFQEWQKTRLQNYDSLSEDSDYSQSSDEEESKKVDLKLGFSRISEKSFEEDSSIDTDSQASESSDLKNSN
jgi:hypothetical protein